MCAATSQESESTRESRQPPLARRTPSRDLDDDLSLAGFVHWLESRWQYARQHTTRARVLFFLKQHMPILEWLPTYDLREDLQYDIVAGITVGMMIVPQEISLSTMMGVPPIYGLYTAALVPMIYPLFGTSRVLSVANGAEVSLLVGSAIKKIESEDERVATGILLSFLSGLILLCMGVFRLGIIADFFSRPVMGGFVSAGGVLIMLSQCANWFGVRVPSRDLPFLTVLDLIEKSPHVNGYSFLLGGVSIGILIGMRWLKRSVVREMAKLEEELEEEFEIETSRAVSRMNSQSSLTDDEDDRVGRQGRQDEDDEKDTERGYDDIELGEVPNPGAPTTATAVHKVKRKDDHHESNELHKPVTSPRGGGAASSSATSATAARPSAVDVTGTPKMANSTARSGLFTSRTRNVLSSPWTTSNAMRNSEMLSPLDARSCRQGDISQITRSTRHRMQGSQVINDEGVGFSLSDEDYLHLEQPLEYSIMNRRAAAGTATPRRSIAMATASPRTISHDDTDSEQPTRATSKPKTLPPNQLPPSYARVKNMASPAKSTSSETASITDSTCSTTALNGRTLEAIVSSSTSIRMLRSKIAVLIALRLVCDLGAFMVCLIGGIIGYLIGEEALKLTGDVPGGYPSPIRPWFGLAEGIIDADRLYHIVIDTLSIAIISYMSSIAMAKRLAIKEGYRIRPNQELIALGFSNLVGSFFRGMPATGGLSRTAVNMQNARTQLASLISVSVVVIALYTATSALAYLPKASLSAIIIVAGQSLIETKEAKWLYRVKRDEFYVWLASFVLTCLLGVLPGLLSSIFCSLIAVIYKTRRPTLTFMGEIVIDEATGETTLVDLELYPDTAQPISDIIVIRVEGALYFANCEYVERVVEREIRKREQTDDVHVRGVVLDACSIMDWDSTTMQMMKHLQEDLLMRGIQLAIVNARDRLHHLLDSTDFLVGIVLQDARIGFHEAIEAIRSAPPPLSLEEQEEQEGSGRHGQRRRGSSSALSTHVNRQASV